MTEFWLALAAGITVSLWNKYLIPLLPKCHAQVSSDTESDSDNSETMATAGGVSHHF